MVATPIPEAVAVWWWSALAAGLVVAVVLVLLLTWLYRSVLAIEQGLGEVWEKGKDLARNTATTWMLGEAGTVLEKLRDEASEHERAPRKGDR